jgi:hypothetical protein
MTNSERGWGIQNIAKSGNFKILYERKICNENELIIKLTFSVYCLHRHILFFERDGERK